MDYAAFASAVRADKRYETRPGASSKFPLLPTPLFMAYMARVYWLGWRESGDPEFELKYWPNAGYRVLQAVESTGGRVIVDGFENLDAAGDPAVVAATTARNFFHKKRHFPEFFAVYSRQTGAPGESDPIRPGSGASLRFAMKKHRLDLFAAIAAAIASPFVTAQSMDTSPPAAAESAAVDKIGNAATIPVDISTWDLDPYSWSVAPDGAALSFGSALVKAPAGGGETFEIRATIRPEKSTSPNWATLGISALRDANNYWTLQMVQRPASQGGGHTCELVPCTDGLWWGDGGFKRTRHEYGKYRWRWGDAYDMILRASPSKIDGEMYDAETGEFMFRSTWEKPGATDVSDVSRRPWRPALRSDGNVFGRVENYLSSVPPDANAAEDVAAFPPFAPSGPDTGLFGAATGFYHVENIDGCDWPVDPLGRAVILAGCNHVKPQGTYSHVLGYSRYGLFVETNYASKAEWAAETLDRLRSWGFTFLGNASEWRVLGRGVLPHVQNIQLGQRVSRGDPDWYILEWNFAPCQALPNVFHPKFAEACEWRAREKCAPEKDDPWLVGWFIDNELRWWGKRASMVTTGLFDAVSALPRSHSARKELERFLQERREESGTAPDSPATFEDKREFLRHYARTYFRITTEAIRKADPNHLVLGCRFAGGFGMADPVVWEEAGRFCDVVTFNCYPWADLDRGIVLDEKGGTPATELLREYHGYAKKPLMITEWSFRALDFGHPCLIGAGQNMQTQAERAEATSLFARTMLADPNVVGYDWFMWADEPPEGGPFFTPEDGNYGLVREDGKPHVEVVNAFTQLHGDLVKWRHAPPPQERIEPLGARPAPSERDRYFAEARAALARSATDAEAAAAQTATAAPRADFVMETDGRWILSNAFVRVSGRIGGDVLADEIALADPAAGDPAKFRKVGRWGALASFHDGGINTWLDTTRLESAESEFDPETGIVSATLRGIRDEAPSFAIESRLSLAPESREILAEIVAFENLGPTPLLMRSLYMRPFPAFESGEKPAAVTQTPYLWHAPARAAWKLPDGAAWGVESHDPTALTFEFWVHKDNGSVHSDAPFAPGGKSKAVFEIAPGESWHTSEPMGARVMFVPPAAAAGGGAKDAAR